LKKKEEKMKKRREKKRSLEKEKEKKNKRPLQLISFNLWEYLIWVRVLVPLMFPWFIIGCSIVFLAFSSTLPKYLSTSFPYL